MPQLSSPLTQSYWPADTSREVLEMTEGQALREAAQKAPERWALVEKMPVSWPPLTGAAQTDRRWTYAQLLDDATACAHWLLQRYQPGQRICLWAPNVPEWVVLQYGASLAGLVLVTANPALRTQELEYVLRQSRASALFHIDQFRGSDMAAMAAEATVPSRPLARKAQVVGKAKNSQYRAPSCPAAWKRSTTPAASRSSTAAVTALATRRATRACSRVSPSVSMTWA